LRTAADFTPSYTPTKKARRELFRTGKSGVRNGRGDGELAAALDLPMNEPLLTLSMDLAISATGPEDRRALPSRLLLSRLAPHSQSV